MSYSIGTVAHLRGRGDVVITAIRRISRGRNVGKLKCTVAPMIAGAFGKTYAVSFVEPERHLMPARDEWTTAQVKEAMEREGNTRADVANARAERTQKRRDAIESSGLQSGDIVTITYRGGRMRRHEVLAVNTRTGKFAIAALRNKSGRRWMEPRHITEIHRNNVKLDAATVATIRGVGDTIRDAFAVIDNA